MSNCSPPSWSVLNYLDENKLYSCISSLTFLTIGVFLYILNSYTVFEKRKIPRAVRPTAPFGNIKDVIFQDTTLYIFLWKYYNKFKRKKCKVGGFFLFFRPGILLVDPSFTNKICLNEVDVEDDYPKKATGLCKNILNISQAKVAKDFLKQFRNVEELLLRDLQEKPNLLSESVFKFVMDTSCLIFGIENSTVVMDLLNIAIEQKYSTNFSYFFKLFYPYFSKQARILKQWKQILDNSITNRKKTDVKTSDVLQKLIDALNETKDTDSTVIYNELFDIFCDSIVQSHSSILWCLYEIAGNSEIQEELLGEVRRYNKENESLDFNKIEELSFLDALIKETFRKYPPVPTMVKKCKKELLTDFGFKLPANSFIFLSVFGIHHDPLNYPNPEHFDPDRFYEDKLQQDIYLPFGYGLRTDIGLLFTSLHVKLFLLTVFSKCKIQLLKDYSVEYDTTKLNVHPKEPLPVHFEYL